MFAEFLKDIAYQFNNEALLQEAMTHPSFAKSVANYQRLEFLGDKVLSLIISEHLMKKYPNENEGALSRRHAALVSGEALAEIALLVGVDKVLRVSAGERNSGGKTNKRNLENALEALIGAIYLDSNYESAKKFVMKFWQDFLEQNIAPPKDPVSQLQEIVQMRFKQLPQYEIIKTSGEEHAPTFTAKVIIANLGLELKAQGKSKKEAQKEVAMLAIANIQSD